MEVYNEANCFSEAGKSHSDPVCLREDFTELGDNDGKLESLFQSFFMELPSELKLKILEFISGVDIANVSCVCSELRCLTSNDDIWKHNYVTQFGNYKESGSERGFREMFSNAWKERKRLSLNVMRRNRYNPFGCDFGEDDDREWLDIVRLCLPARVPVPAIANGNDIVKL